MSTRRARIKAVATLPVRRKNINASGSVKTNISAPTDSIENKSDSPKLSQEIPSDNQQEKAQHVTNDEPQKDVPISTQKEVLLKETQNDETLKSKLLEPQNKVQQTPNSADNSAILRSSYVSTPKTTISNNSSSASPLYRTQNPIVKFVGSPSPLILKSLANQTAKSLTPKHTTTEPVTETKDLSKNIQTVEGVSKIIYPESGPDVDVLDGIVPLHSKRNLPKPIDLVKSDLLTENAEVLFDPIVPLPSPSKARPKLRPAPRLAFRRNSVQGSASESEDESRRALLATPGAQVPRQRHDSHSSSVTQSQLPTRLVGEVSRIRNDSVSSVVSQSMRPSQAVPPSPLLDKQLAKSRRAEASRRMSAMRRRQRARDDVSRQELTMYDLIFFNPTTNPIVPEENEQEALKDQNSIKSAANQAPEVTQEEEVDDPPAEENAAPVPQIKLGPNGEIILDEKSLVIEQTEDPRKLSSTVVHETAYVSGAGGKYSRIKRTQDWTDAETVRFYRALAAVGTDFTLMGPMFPGRTRRDLKIKFKKEERSNGAQVDKALRSQTQWDGERLQEEFAEERKIAVEKAEAEKEELKRLRKEEKNRVRVAKHILKISKGSRALEMSTAIDTPVAGMTADSIIQNAIEQKLRNKQKKAAPMYQRQQTAQRTLNIQDSFATITPLNKGIRSNPTNDTTNDIVTLTPSQHPSKTPDLAPKAPIVPPNIENGSLVVLTVNDPKDPTKKMLQTYISHGAGKLTPIALPSTLLNSVVGYMKKGGTPRSVSSASSPQLMSPCSVTSQDSASRSSVIINPSPSKRRRNDSFTVTPL